MATYYKVSLTDKDGSTGYMVFKTAKANVEEVLKASIVPLSKLRESTFLDPERGEK